MGTFKIPRGEPVQFVPSAVTVRAGSGTPASNVTAVVSSLYCRTDGGTVTGVYAKASGSGSTGWAELGAVAGGGTGLATLTAHALYVGNGTSAMNAVSVGATGTVLIGTTGADPSFSANPTVTSVTLNRVFGSGGTAQTTTNVAISGWGASATKGISGTDARGTITVTTNASDTASANPTIVLTFADGTYTNAPIVVASFESTSTGPVQQWLVTSNATTATFTYKGTPTATQALTYKLNYVVVG